MSDEKKKDKRGIVIMVLNIVIMICNYVLSILTPTSKEVACRAIETIFA